MVEARKAPFYPFVTWMSFSEDMSFAKTHDWQARHCR
jgi:hypothetical protein